MSDTGDARSVKKAVRRNWPSLDVSGSGLGSPAAKT